MKNGLRAGAGIFGRRRGIRDADDGHRQAKASTASENASG
jgi:hypothetical protein